MLVTLFGIVMLVTPYKFVNAPFPMLVTGRPLIVLGIIKAPYGLLLPSDSYPVMVIVPLLVV